MDYEKKNREILEGVKKIHSGIKEVLAELGDSNLPLANILNEAVWALNKQFPELAESEDERVRKLLVWQVHRNIEDETNDLAGSIYDGIKGHDPDLEESIEDWKKCLAWLEKQKEQKPRLIGEDSVEKMARQMYETGQTIEEQKPVLTAKEAWEEMRLEVYAQVSGNRHEPNCSDDSTKMFSLCDIDEIIEKINNSIVEQKPAEWSEEDDMETINVFRPLAGTSIESATKQAVNKFTYSGKKFLLAFNGVFILIDNTKSVQDIVSEYNRSLGGKKKEQGQSEGEPNDFEITLNDCMLAAQQYPPGKIGWDVVKMWAEELSELIEQPKQEWDEFDEDCLKRAIWYVENPAPSVVKDTNLALWLQSLPQRFSLQPKQEWSEEDRKNIERLIEILPKCIFRHPSILERDECRDLGVWLRNLLYYPQKLEGWKPSAEQMSMLLSVIRDPNNAGAESCHLALVSLYNDLKKL